MAAPATQGKLCTRLQDMEIGDYIQWHYKADSANVAGEFTDISSGGGYEGLNLAELPTTPGTTANGSFYFLKVDKGLLVADRMVQTNISAQALNAKNYLQGHMQGRSVFRCLSQSEWTKYLTNGDCGGCITKRDNNVWHSVNKGVTNLANNVDRNIQQFIANQYVEILQDVKNNKVRISMLLSGATYNNTYLMRFYSNGENFGREDYLPLENDFSTALIFINHVKRADRYSRFYNYFSFRPAMEYVDNPNSKNIWY